MKIECPSCHYSAETDSSRIPPGGTRVRCPRCTTVFPVSLPAAITIRENPTSVTCPKCGAVQDVAESCALCGLIYEKYRVAEERRQAVSAIADAKPVSTPQADPEVDQGVFHFGFGRSEIMAWVGEGRIAVNDLPHAVRIVGMLPGTLAWRRFLDALLLWMGAVFLAVAVIFFFAYNWNELGRFARFSIVELLLVFAVLASWRLGLERMPGKAALMVATLLVGSLLALVGQTYQTGADPWELFASWALCILPWVAISCFAPLWLFLLALVNLAVSLYFHAFAGVFGLLFGTETIWWILAGVNTIALIAWEVAAVRGVPWLGERWAPRIVATVAAGYISFLAVWGIIDRNSAGVGELLGYGIWLVCAYAGYRHRLKDLYVLALGVLSLVVVFSVFLGKNMASHGDAGALLFIGMVVLGASAIGGWWLRSVAQEVEA